MLLTLLHLNIRNIRLGPKLPGFATPTMVEVLNKKFNLMPIGDVKTDVSARVAQNDRSAAWLTILRLSSQMAKMLQNQ